MTTLVQPDLLFWEGRFRDDLALVLSEEGRVLEPVRLPVSGLPLRLPKRALLPGLVNGHSHAFQRLLRGRTEYVAHGRAADDFWSWREAMYRAATALDPDEVFVASRQAFLEMALAGITSVGEFHYLHHGPSGESYENRNELALQVIRAAREVGLRICLLRVGYARAGHEVPENPRQRRFIDPDVEAFLDAAQALAEETRGDGAVSVGLAPHSVRAVPKDWLSAVASGAQDAPVHMHVAEQPREIEACVAEHGRRPVELLSELGLLSERFTAVHGIHLLPNETSLLGAAKATVCACPSTERNLGDGVVSADALLEAGAQVSLGSDSQVCLDLLEEARQLESHLRLARLRRAVLDPGDGQLDGLAQRLFSLCTRHGARSLRLPVGELRVGAPADFFTVDLGHPSLAGADPASLLPAIVFGMEKAAVREVAVGGRLIVQDGHHPLQVESTRAFGALSRRLFS